MKNDKMKEDLLHQKTYQKCIERLDRIAADTKPQWGSMDAAQMLAHCAAIQETNNGKPLKFPFLLKLFSPLIKKTVLNGNYKKSMRTYSAYRQTTPKDFAEEKQRLLNALDLFFSLGPEKAESIKHPFFGRMTAAEKGRAMYKHLDYHLTQFGV